MAETALPPRPPLHTASLPAGPDVTVTLCDILCIGIATAPGAAAALNLPAPGTSRAWEGGHILWSGIDRWLALLQPVATPMTTLQTAHGPATTLTDLTDARIALRIAGPQARAALSRLAPIDLHPRAFPPGATAATLAAHIAIQLWHQPGHAAPTYLLLAPSSYATSLMHAIDSACLTFNRTEPAR